MGGLIVLTNVRTIIRGEPFGARGWAEGGPLLVITLIWAAAILWAVRAHRTEKAALAAESASRESAATAG